VFEGESNGEFVGEFVGVFRGIVGGDLCVGVFGFFFDGL